MTGPIAEAIWEEQKTSARCGEPIVNVEPSKSSTIAADALLKNLSTKISALSADGTQSATVRLATAKMSCGYCKATSDREEEYRKKAYDIKVCDYCNIRGHTHGECYALSRAIRAASSIRCIHSLWTCTGGSAQTPRTSDVRRSPNMNSAGRPSRDYDNRRQPSGYQGRNRHNYPSRKLRPTL